MVDSYDNIIKDKIIDKIIPTDAGTIVRLIKRKGETFIIDEMIITVGATGEMLLTK